jgi:hypothetical protein
MGVTANASKRSVKQEAKQSTQINPTKIDVPSEAYMPQGV